MLWYSTVWYGCTLWYISVKFRLLSFILQSFIWTIWYSFSLWWLWKDICSEWQSAYTHFHLKYKVDLKLALTAQLVYLPTLIFLLVDLRLVLYCLADLVSWHPLLTWLFLRCYITLAVGTVSSETEHTPTTHQSPYPLQSKMLVSSRVSIFGPVISWTPQSGPTDLPYCDWPAPEFSDSFWQVRPITHVAVPGSRPVSGRGGEGGSREGKGAAAFILGKT